MDECGKRRLTVTLAAIAIGLVACISISALSSDQPKFEFLSTHEPACTLTGTNPNGDTCVDTVYSFQADYQQFCLVADEELGAHGYRVNPHGQGEYGKMSTEAVVIAFYKDQVFHAKAPAGSGILFEYAHKEGWVSVTVSRVQPRNKLLFLLKVWASYVIPMK